MLENMISNTNDDKDDEVQVMGSSATKRVGKNIKWNEENETIFVELILQHQAHRKTNKKRDFKWNDLTNDLFMHPNFHDFDRSNACSLQRKFQRLKTAFYQRFNGLTNSADFPPTDNRKDAILYQLLYENTDKSFDLSYDDVDDDGSESPDTSNMQLLEDIGRHASGNSVMRPGSGVESNLLPPHMGSSSTPTRKASTVAGPSTLKRRREDADGVDTEKDSRRRYEVNDKITMIKAEADARSKFLQLENENLRLQKEVEQAKADRAKSETILHLTEMLHDLQRQYQQPQAQQSNHRPTNSNGNGSDNGLVHNNSNSNHTRL